MAKDWAKLSNRSETARPPTSMSEPRRTQQERIQAGGLPGTPPDVLPDPYPPPSPEPDGPGLPEPDPDPSPLDPEPSPGPIN
jgi:hypothetical protein